MRWWSDHVDHNLPAGDFVFLEGGYESPHFGDAHRFGDGHDDDLGVAASIRFLRSFLTWLEYFITRPATEPRLTTP